MSRRRAPNQCRRVTLAVIRFHLRRLGRAPAGAARFAIRSYQLTLSVVLGRQCRFAPTCSAYADAAIARHGLWAGGWMAAARLCRCRPGSAWGFDPPPDDLPPGAAPLRPWRYGQWRGPLRCEPTDL